MQVVLSSSKTLRLGLLVLSLLVYTCLSSLALAHAVSATLRLSPTSGLPTSSVKAAGSGLRNRVGSCSLEGFCHKKHH